MTEVSKYSEVDPKAFVSKHKISDDHERNIKIDIIDDLQLDSRSAKDQLQKEDRHQLVRNGGLKAWAKRTALTAVQWKVKMMCPLTNFGIQGCRYHITVWNRKEMFIAHWQIYHIDQHAGHILCEHRNKDDVPCHYMTDREADMKNHMYKLHEATLQEKIASNNYVKENTWLDLTSSWSIKDLDRSYKTFPEVRHGTMYDLLVCVIMDTTEEDPRKKANAFRVPPYDSKEWDTMLSIGTHTIKDMKTALAAIVDSPLKRDIRLLSPIVHS